MRNSIYYNGKSIRSAFTKMKISLCRTATSDNIINYHNDLKSFFIYILYLVIILI